MKEKCLRALEQKMKQKRLNYVDAGCFYVDQPE